MLTVGDDDYNHDVNPIKKGGANPTQQGGNVYAYVERGRATKTSMRNFCVISPRFHQLIYTHCGPVGVHRMWGQANEFERTPIHPLLSGSIDHRPMHVKRHGTGTTC